MHSQIATATFLIALVAAGCGGARAAGGGSSMGPICEPPADTSRTLLIGWAPADRAVLETAPEGSVAVARYDGCTLELLDDCRLAGTYQLEDSARSTGGLTVRDEKALRAAIPLGAAALAAELDGGGALALTYVTATTAVARLSARDRGMLSGRCDRATHFVRSIVRGAYEIERGAGSSATRRVVRDGGDLARCRNRKTDAGDPACRAIVQIALTPIAELTAGRDDLYDDLSSDVAGISRMEEALRALQQMAGGAQPPASISEANPGSAPTPPAGPLSELSRGILAVPDGGSDAWDQAVAPMLIAAYDKNASKRIDTADEIAAIPCDVLATMDAAVRGGRGGAAALRTTYGFPNGYIWVGYALGFDEKVRADADARLANCGL